jgi:hypothetical protein
LLDVLNQKKARVNHGCVDSSFFKLLAQLLTPFSLLSADSSSRLLYLTASTFVLLICVGRQEKSQQLVPKSETGELDAKARRVGREEKQIAQKEAQLVASIRNPFFIQRTERGGDSNAVF